MEPKDIQALIRFHENGLAQYRLVMAITAQHLVEQTIEALRQLEEIIKKGGIESDNQGKANNTRGID